MIINQLMVEQFHEAMGRTKLPEKPIWPEDKIRELRVRLIEEELQELKGAKNLVDVADALGDLLYVTIGAAVEYGINITPIFVAIHENNMTKFKDGYMREDGKWMKGPSYVSVNLKPIIDAQLNGYICKE